MIAKPFFRRLLIVAAVCTLAGSLVSFDENPLPLSMTMEESDDRMPEADLTSDQLGVSLTADFPTAVLSQFEQGSTGAALLRRLSNVSANLGRNTKLIVVKGSDVQEGAGLLSEEQLIRMARIYLNGGCVAVETPTYTQLQTLMDALQSTIADLKEEEWMYKYGLDTSWLEEQKNTRLANLRSCATRAGVEGADEVAAEMVIIGATEYFYQEPFDENPRVTTYTVDENGNQLLGSPQSMTVDQTDYNSGVMADAAASWLNGLAGLRKEQPMLGGEGAGIINSLMSASETFSHYSSFLRRTSSNCAVYDGNIVTTFRSWGVHNIAEDRDFYYIRQSVQLECARLFKGVASYDDNTWQIASGYGDYDRWYGSFLSRYTSTMDLLGSGSIRLEEALPYTDNSNSMVSITCGQSSSNTETLGCTWGINAGGSASGPSMSINWGGSYSLGHTEGTSFSMGYAKNYKDLAVKKNTNGNAVTWTYEGHLPEYREEQRDGYIYYCHGKPADILVNDANLDNEICWSVSNPTGQFTLHATMVPETAALLFARGGSVGNKPHKYEYTTRTDDKDFNYQLLQPNRNIQNWRMYVTIDEWEDKAVAGALGYLEQNLVSAFPAEYRQAFSLADKTPRSLEVITANIAHAKEVFRASNDILLNYAESWGIKQYTIHWRCDDTQNVPLQDSYVVAQVHQTPFKLKAVGGSETNYYESYGKVLDNNFKTKWKVERKDRGADYQGDKVWYVDFTSEEPILPSSFTIVMGDDIEEHPENAPYECRILAWLEESQRWSYLGGLTDYDFALTNNGGFLQGVIAPAIHDRKFDRFRFVVMEDYNYGAYEMLEMNELVLNP